MKDKIFGQRSVAIKISLYGLLFIILIEIYRKLLFLLKIRILSGDTTFSSILLLYIVFLIVCKHKYWLISWSLLFISKLSEVIIATSFKSNEFNIYNKIVKSDILVSTIGVFLLLVSLSYLIKFWRVKNYSDYFRFK